MCTGHLHTYFLSCALFPTSSHPFSTWMRSDIGSQLTASSTVGVNSVTKVNGFFSEGAVQIVTPQSLAHFPGQPVPQASCLRALKAEQGQDMLCYPWNSILGLCCPLGLPVLLKMSAVQYGSLGPHVTIGHLICGYCEWGAELFVVFHFN